MKLIMLYINKNKEYKKLLKSSNFTIEDYISRIRDIVSNDIHNLDSNINLRNQNDIATLMQYYTGNCDILEFTTKLKLIQYAKFLIKMYRDVVEYNIDDYRQQHQAEYIVYCNELNTDLYCGDLIWFISSLYDKELE